MIMSVGWNYVSELPQQTGLLWYRLVCEYAEPWWNDINRGSLLIRTRALWQSYQQNHLEQVGGTWRSKWWIQLSKYLYSYSEATFTCREILWCGAFDLTSPIIKWRRAADFIALNIPSPVWGLNPRILGPMASTLTITPPMGLMAERLLHIREIV
jgi:hypothetical protein